MKKLILVATFFLCLAVPPGAQAQTTGKTVVVRLFEAPSSRLYISYGDGKTELQELAGITGKKEQKENTEQLQRIIDRLYAEGYRLVNSFGSSQASAPVSTLVFRKD
ncbi:hypothetical protein [Hymenobacter lucidus]|uniref:DUF4907 domain-containing protein n=1 Tax=Hymenobacter lucidus TaxID=2880930 RepID=A0ABS8AUA8_9BACT|nr:hypothetical protein [Hymenobacter lucidus]MCB2409815.1 hypothetical protein [Hymenobacter lucidus]